MTYIAATVHCEGGRVSLRADRVSCAIELAGLDGDGCAFELTHAQALEIASELERVATYSQIEVRP